MIKINKNRIDSSVIYYVYSVMCHEDERALCELEVRQLLAVSTTIVAGLNVVISSRDVDVTRSPFLKQRIAAWRAALSTEQLIEQLSALPLNEQHNHCNERFKVEVWKEHVMEQQVDEWEWRDEQSDAKEQLARVAVSTPAHRQQLARQIGEVIVGEVDLQQPEVIFGVVFAAGRWHFGEQVTNSGRWLRHRYKPRQYSTALTHRMARSIVNIAIPKINNFTIIDLCCGIGTVLLEAASMNIAIAGNDHNHHIVQGARENIAYFGYETTVTVGDMQLIQQKYDIAILDMPYNICSTLSESDKQSMLEHARYIASRLVIITVEPLDTLLEDVGFSIIDRCTVRKGNLVREIIVLE
ncbi:TRM11 family SAM-dependent methyltransferase [Paenibacillus yanchengensis]|uniref:TRM11 family SAM-dependent methyltransferase n=1 Tax=Paenibacillus yanchengensis TaxID=2035833 RepID=A0ABW4YGB4_9BACL